MVKLKSAGFSDKGPIKAKNEDAFIYRITDIGDLWCGLFAVSDGVGSLKNSDIASSYIVTELGKWWEREIHENARNVVYILDKLKTVILESNEALIRIGKAQEAKCAATLSLLFVYGTTGYIFHTGDSRIYRLSAKLLGYDMKQLTVDHSENILRETENGPVLKSYLTECIGAKENFELFREEFTIDKNDTFLLCSDGVFKTQSDAEIAGMLKRKKAPEDISEKLVEGALVKGETDNITALVVKVV